MNMPFEVVVWLFSTIALHKISFQRTKRGRMERLAERLAGVGDMTWICSQCYSLLLHWGRRLQETKLAQVLCNHVILKLRWCRSMVLFVALVDCLSKSSLVIWKRATSPSALTKYMQFVHMNVLLTMFSVLVPALRKPVSHLALTQAVDLSKWWFHRSWVGSWSVYHQRRLSEGLLCWVVAKVLEKNICFTWLSFDVALMFPWPFLRCILQWIARCPRHLIQRKVTSNLLPLTGSVHHCQKVMRATKGPNVDQPHWTERPSSAKNTTWSTLLRGRCTWIQNRTTPSNHDVTCNFTLAPSTLAPRWRMCWRVCRIPWLEIQKSRFCQKTNSLNRRSSVNEYYSFVRKLSNI